MGIGARELIAAQIRRLGSNLVTVTPGSARMGSVSLGSGAAPRLSEEDAAAVGSEIPGVVVAAPLLHAREQLMVGASNWQGVLRGVTPEYFVAREWRVFAGRELTPEDNQRAANVVLLGTTMREKLFGESDPLDASIRIRDVPFTVVGLLERKRAECLGDNQDDIALVPLRTARRQFVGTSRANPTFVHNITVKFAEGASAEDVMSAIRELFQIQFLVEAMTLSLVGGFLGALVGVTVAATIGILAQWPIVIDLSAVLIAVSFAGLVECAPEGGQIGLRN
ncbi:ABC transporter permease [Pseudaminobacter sp. NGMCC 1.201702]|uniref:ABC transporter permease n=1 Tax=Pseudaminobacter sp. NGMCC 1.201702 TaxID=3391825 RepID=UPI0039F13106